MTYTQKKNNERKLRERKINAMKTTNYKLRERKVNAMKTTIPVNEMRISQAMKTFSKFQLTLQVVVVAATCHYRHGVNQ